MIDHTMSIVVSEPSSLVTIAKPSAMTDAQLIEAIYAAHAEAEQAAATALTKAMAAGDALIEAKHRCQHGEWGGWLAEHFSGSARTARSYMRLASHRDELESKMAESAVLSIDSAVKALSDVERSSELDAMTERIKRGAASLAEELSKEFSSALALCGNEDCPHEEFAMMICLGFASRMSANPTIQAADIAGWLSSVPIWTRH